MTESPMSLARRIHRMEADIARMKAGMGTPQLASSSIEDGSVDEHDVDGRLVSRIGKQVDGSHGSRVVESPAQPRPDAPDLSVGKTGVIAVRWSGGADGPVPLIHGHIEVQAMGPSDSDWQVVGTIRDRDGGATTFAADESGTTQVRLVLVGQDRVTRSEASEVSTVEVELPASTSEVQAAIESADGKNVLTYDPEPPAADGQGIGDVHFKINDVTGVPQQSWRWDGTDWVPMTFGDGLLESLSAGKITAGVIEAAVGIGSSGYIRSTDAAGRMSEMVGAGFRTEAADGTIIFDSRGGTGADSTFFGLGATSSGEASTAVGRDASATRAFSTALGEASFADQEGTTALGRSSEATGYASSAIGTYASSSGINSAAVGAEASASSDDSSAFGRAATASGAHATAIGNGTKASGGDSAALGRGAEAIAERTTALGTFASAPYLGATALGTSAVADASNGTSLGASSRTRGESATAVGTGARADAAESTAVGWQTWAQGVGSVALGRLASAEADASSVLGRNANATNVGGTALGYQAASTHNYATALGYNASAGGDVSTALGPGSSASGYASVAIGRASEVTADNTGVLGGSGSTQTNHWVVPGDLDVQGTAGGDGLIREVSSPLDDWLGNTVQEAEARILLGRIAIVTIYISSADIPQDGDQDTPVVRLVPELAPASNREQWTGWAGGGIGIVTGLIRSNGDVSIRWSNGTDPSALIVTTLNYMIS